MIEVFLNRDDDDAWDWVVQEDGEYVCSLPVPTECESHDIHSSTLFAALEAEGFDTTAHLFYVDSDYGPIGEWNRPEEG